MVEEVTRGCTDKKVLSLGSNAVLCQVRLLIVSVGPTCSTSPNTKSQRYFMDEADAILRSLGYVILLTGYAPVVAPYPRVF